MRRRTGAIVAAAIAFAASAGTLRAGFVWDDRYQILANPLIRQPSLLGAAFTTHVVGFLPQFRTSFYRPLVHVLYAGVYSAFGIEPWAYHLTSLVLHAAVSGLVYLLISRWTSPRAALLASILFAVHPVHSEAVAWAAGVYDVSVAFWILLAVLALIDERPAVRVIIAPLCFAAGLLWKESAMALLPIAVIFFSVKRERRWREVTGLILAAAGYLALRVNALGGLTGGGHNPLRVSSAHSILTAIAVSGEYVRMLLLPIGLSAVHDFPVITTPLHPRFIAGLAVLLALALGALRFRHRPEIVLGLSLLIFPILPALYIPALKDSFLAERYLYLPSAGACLLVAVALERWPATRVVAAVVALVFAASTVVRNEVWHDGVALFTDAVAKAPQSAVALDCLGSALAVEKRCEEAIPPLTQALEIDPHRQDAHANLALCLGRMGRREEGIPHALAAVAECPDCTQARKILDWLTSAQ